MHLLLARSLRFLLLSFVLVTLFSGCQFQIDEPLDEGSQRGVLIPLKSPIVAMEDVHGSDYNISYSETIYSGSLKLELVRADGSTKSSTHFDWTKNGGWQVNSRFGELSVTNGPGIYRARATAFIGADGMPASIMGMVGTIEVSGEGSFKINLKHLDSFMKLRMVNTDGTLISYDENKYYRVTLSMFRLTNIDYNFPQPTAGENWQLKMDKSASTVVNKQVSEWTIGTIHPTTFSGSDVNTCSTDPTNISTELFNIREVIGGSVNSPIYSDKQWSVMCPTDGDQYEKYTFNSGHLNTFEVVIDGDQAFLGRVQSPV